MSQLDTWLKEYRATNGASLRELEEKKNLTYDQMLKMHMLQHNTKDKK